MAHELHNTMNCTYTIQNILKTNTELYFIYNVEYTLEQN